MENMNGKLLGQEISEELVQDSMQLLIMAVAV